MKMVGWTGIVLIAVSGIVWDIGYHNSGGTMAFAGFLCLIAVAVKFE